MRHEMPPSTACLTIACPVCGENVGDQCKSLTNGAKVYPHVDRMTAWRKQQEPPKTDALFGDNQ